MRIFNIRTGLILSLLVLSICISGCLIWAIPLLKKDKDTSSGSSASPPPAPPAGPPSTPLLVSPADAAQDQSLTLSLDWSDSTGSQPITYTLQVDNNNDFSSPVISQTNLATSQYTVLAGLAKGPGLIWANNVPVQPRPVQPFKVKVNHQLGVKPVQRYVPDEIIVKFKRGTVPLAINKLNEKHGATVLSTHSKAVYKRLRIPKAKTVEEMVNIYQNNPDIEYAEPNYYCSILMTPNDPAFPFQWHFHDHSGGRTGGINMESAWDIQAGGNSSVIVAVIDTGVAYEDYDVYQKAPDLVNTNFVAGYDFINDDSHPNDDNGHGTHVTGTIAQSTNNSVGVAGIAFNCSIMPIKVLNVTGTGTVDIIAQGIYFATDQGAQVINMSLGGPDSSSTLANACAYAYNHGVTIVCASGNDDGGPVSYPAAYNDYCIAVGATRYDETRSYYSNYGPQQDIVAPGGDVTVDQNDDGYADGILQQTFEITPTEWAYYFFQGTSMAAPHVAGVAALIISRGVSDGVPGPDNVRNILQRTAKDLGPAGWDQEYGWGLLDAYAALSEANDPSGLAYGTTYYWRVMASNAVGTSTWSIPRTFTTVNISGD